MHRLFVPVLTLLVSAPALAVPTLSTHQGRLFDALGAPLDGDHDLALSLYANASGGTALWSETQVDVAFDNGYFVVDLGAVNALDAGDFDGSTLWFEMTVDSGPALSRLPLHSVPYAFNAESALSADTALSVDWSNVTGAPSTTLGDLACAAGDAAVWDGSAWGCDDLMPIDASAIASGTVDIGRLPVGGSNTEVAAGDHSHALSALTGVVDINALPVGTTSAHVAAGDHVHGGDDITSGTVATARLNVGDTAGTVAAGDHSHDLADLGGDLELPIVSSAPAPASGVGKLYAKPYANQGGEDNFNVLMLHSDTASGSTNFPDSSPAATSFSVTGTVEHSNATSKFGATAMDFRGGGYLTASDSPNWDFPADFTIDFWVYLESVPYSFILVHRNYPTYSSGSWHAYLNSNGQSILNFTCGNSAGQSFISLVSSSQIPLNTWTHVGIVREGGTATMYFDGVQQAQDTSAAGNCGGDPAPLRIGELQNYGPDDFDGLLDEVRISKGIARWSGPFTPPTRAYDAGGSGTGLFFIDEAGTEHRVQLVED